jgi:hypothetical protein
MCIYVAISILQSLCVGEGLFPPNINTFIYHEMVHLVPMVEQFGPPREIWEFRGERLVRQIKDSAPNKGGVSLEISAVKMYMAMESEKTTTVYNEEAYGEADENLPAKESISLQCVSESRRIIFNKEELIELLTCIIASVPLSAEAIHDLKTLKITIECTHQDTVVAALGSRFCWLGYTKSVYLKATSNVATDINIKGRGIQFHRAYDSIKSNWWKSSQVNSWARLKSAPKLLKNPNPPKAAAMNSPMLSCEMVQINCFFTVCCPPNFGGIDSPDQSMLNSTQFALVHCRKGKLNARTNTIEISLTEEQQSTTKLLLCNEIILQQMVVLGLNTENKPIYLGNNPNVSRSLVEVNPENVDRLVLFQIGTLN